MILDHFTQMFLCEENGHCTSLGCSHRLLRLTSGRSHRMISRNAFKRLRASERSPSIMHFLSRLTRDSSVPATRTSRDPILHTHGERCERQEFDVGHPAAPPPFAPHDELSRPHGLCR